MKVTTILIFAFLMQVSAAGLAQKITLNEKNASLESVIDKIRSQTGFEFVFNVKDVDKAKKVNLNVRSKELTDVLEELFEDQELSFSIKDKFIVLKPKERSFFERVVARLQAFDVHGRVIDEAAKPVQGATVRTKNGKQTTVTNLQGSFTFKNVNEGDEVIITFIGYNSATVPVAEEMGNIQLAVASSKLDEVQVQGYGRTSLRLATGNITSIKDTEIEKQPVGNLLYTLQGRVPGMTITPTSGLPGAPVAVQIRGRNSYSFVTNPLYIVDGLQYTETIPPALKTSDGIGALVNGVSALSFINPNDIESISVLKDADATAIYGSRGANGVIVITTKKGKSGVNKVEFNIQSGVSDVPNRLQTMNTQQYLSMRKEALINDGRISRLDDPAFSSLYPDLMLFDQNKYTDWQKVYIGNLAKYTDVQASTSGGSDAVQYLIGGNYHHETLVFPGENADTKGSAHFSITGNSTDRKFKTMLTGSYLSDNSKLPPIDYTNQAVITEPNAPDVYNTDGTVNWALYPATGQTSNWLKYPYSAHLLNPYEAKTNNLMASANISYRSGKFIFSTAVGYNALSRNTFYAQTLSAYPPNLATRTNLRAATYNDFNVKHVNIEPQLNYGDEILGGKLDVLLGGSYQSTSDGTKSMRLEDFPSDFVLRDQSAAVTIRTLANASSQYKYTAAFARVSYNFRDKYLLNLNARRDGSSRFGPGTQFGNFGSVGAAWIFSEEPFMKKNLPFLSFGKIRMSYGTSGNDGIGNYQYLEQYQSVADNITYQGQKGYQSGGIFNVNYHWESTKKLELGIETGFLEDRILLATSYFRNRSDNQLKAYPLPSMVGYGSYTYNSPLLIQNTGIEMVLSTVNVKSLNFNWSSNLNFSFNRNKLLKFPDPTNSPYSQLQVGQPLDGFIYVYQSAGVDPITGVYQFKNKNGDVVTDPRDPEDIVNGGKFIRIFTAPKFNGGFSNTLSYKNLSLDVFLQFIKQMGLNPLYQATFAGGRNNQLAELYGKEWKQPGDVMSIQKFTSTLIPTGQSYGSYVTSDAAYTDASFIRVKNISLSYKLPQTMVDWLHLKNLRLYMLGQNVFTITKYKGFDPETQSLGVLPSLRTITMGIQVGL